MVMAGTERPPAPSTDDSLTSRLQWLQQRREALQEKLASKNNELKNLCLDEAELTGILPPEIPLEPGESPPTFRRRVGTCVAYPQNLINRLKTSEANLTDRLKTNDAEESTLELERQLQMGIAKTALSKLSDPAESKTVQRKQRSIYQQSQRRLRELDARLKFIRQAYGRVHLRPHTSTLEPSSHSTGDLTQSQTNAKHRTKKPRPPLDNLECESGAKTLPSRTILQETGISLSPSGAESHQQTHIYRQSSWNSREYRMPLEEPSSSTLPADARNYNHGMVSPTMEGAMDRRRNAKYPEHDYNDNHDLYILPDRYRPRTYSQGTQGSNGGGVNVCGQKYCQDTERNYRTIPNTYTEEERQIRYRQMQQKRHLDSYNSQQQQQPQQILPQHQKPPPHQNYRNYNIDQQQHNQQLLDNRSPQLPYSQSDEFPSRSNVRYRNLPEEPRESKKNHVPPQIQRGRNMREPVPIGRLSKTNLQECSPPETVGQLPGYWMRENDEAVWSEESTPERFGSLDRRKYSAQCAAYNAGLQQTAHEDRGGQQQQPRYSTQQQQQQHSGSSIASSSSSSRDYVLGLSGATKYPSSSAVTSHHQNYNSQVLQQQQQQQQQGATTGCSSPSYEGVSGAPRTLVRTQSLGSVETWQQTPGGAIAARDLHELQQSPSMRRDDCAGRRGKEKEWYETWMDSGYPGPLSPGFDMLDHPQIREIPIARQIQPPVTSLHPAAVARSAAMQPSFEPPPPPPPPPPSPPLPSYNSKGPPRGANLEQQQRIAAQQQQQQRYNQNRQPPPPQRHPPSPKSREIPAESKPSAERRQRGDETMTTGSDRSPDLCTIVQAGKYQPYREVTKPFEMSDFYKYSTKYRKRAEAITQMRNAQLTTSNANGEEDDNNLILARRRHDSTGIIRDDDGNHICVNPVQRKIYEPVQRMTCQPYGNSGKTLGDDGNADWRASNTSHASSEDSTVV